MGPGGFSIWQLLIILVIVALLFGTKRLSSIGSDVGSAIKGFKKSISDEEDDKSDKDEDARQVEADEKDAKKSGQSAKKSKADSKS